METLFAALVVKTVNDDERVITGMASTPTPDRVNDEIDPKGLTYDAQTPLLLNHRGDSPVGSVQFGAATSRGLPFSARIASVAEDGVVKDRCNEAWHSVRNGLIKGVSIGFMPKEYACKDTGGVRYARAHIHELSLTALPCNPEAMITAFKGLHASEQEPATPESAAPQAARINLLKYL